MQKLFLFTFLLVINSVSAQKSIDAVLKKYNKGNVTYIQVDEAKKLKNAVFLDARETSEFQVSHIENASFVGFNNFDEKKFLQLKIAKNAPIVVYCSVGVRSEKIGFKLKNLGYTNVYNLYGGIFEWKNKNGKVVNNLNQETNKVHCYSPEWGQYLTNGECAYE